MRQTHREKWGTIKKCRAKRGGKDVVVGTSRNGRARLSLSS